MPRFCSRCRWPPAAVLAAVLVVRVIVTSVCTGCRRWPETTVVPATAEVIVTVQVAVAAPPVCRCRSSERRTRPGPSETIARGRRVRACIDRPIGRVHRDREHVVRVDRVVRGRRCDLDVGVQRGQRFAVAVLAGVGGIAVVVRYVGKATRRHRRVVAWMRHTTDQRDRRSCRRSGSLAGRVAQIDREIDIACRRPGPTGDRRLVMHRRTDRGRRDRTRAGCISRTRTGMNRRHHRRGQLLRGQRFAVAVLAG